MDGIILEANRVVARWTNIRDKGVYEAGEVKDLPVMREANEMGKQV